MTVTKLPTSIDLFIGQYSNQDDPIPRLMAPVSATDTIFNVSSPLKDQNGDIVSGGFEIGVRTAEGWTETCFVQAGSVSADGKTWGTVLLPIIRGIRPSGYDYLTGDTDFASAHEADEVVFCNIPTTLPEAIRSVLQGIIATGSNSFIIGIDAVGVVTIKRSSGVGTALGFLRWDSATTKAQFSNDGVSWTAFDDTVASVLVKVSSNDTTPGYLNGKLLGGSGITLTEGNDGGNETLTISADATPSFTALEDVSAGAPVAPSATASNIENVVRNALTSPGSPVSFDTGSVTYVSVCKVDAGKVAVIYKESNVWNVICGTIAGASQVVVWGTKQTISATADTVKPDCAYVSAGKVIFVYVDSSHNLKARVATVSGTVFTFGTEASVKSATVTTPSVALVDSGKVMFAFNHGTGFGRVSIATISGTTLTVDTANEQQFAAATCTFVSASKAATAKGFIAYVSATDAFGIAVSCGSTTPAPGTAVAVDTNTPTYTKVRYVSTDKVFLCWRDTVSNVNQARIATISGTVVTYPTAELIVSSVADCTDLDAVVFATGKIFVGWRDNTSNLGSLQEIVLTGTSTLTLFLAPVDYYASAISASSAVAMADINLNNKFIVLYVDSSTNDGAGRVYQDFSNTHLYMGIAQSTVAAGATVSVKEFGIDLNQTGLTPGTNVNSQGLTLGRALTTTSMEIVVDSHDPSIVFEYAADTGSTDDYQISLSPAWTSLVIGKPIKFKAGTANTGACTLNVNGLGAVSIKKFYNSTLDTNDILANQIIEVIYDGTNFQINTPTLTIYKTLTASKNAADASTTQNIAHGLGRIPKFTSITAVVGSGTQQGQSHTAYDGTTQASQSIYWPGGTITQDTNFTLNNAGVAGTQVGVITWDTTNIIITWTKTNSPSGVYGLLVRVEG